MYEGTVKTIDHEEGYGYIEEMDKSRIMFMLGSVIGPIAEEDKVAYDIERNPTLLAINVTRIAS
jgi:cold shock CspA family protein